MPFRMDGFFALRVLVPLLFRGLFHRLLTTMTSPGRRVRRRMMTRGGPLIRVKRRDLAHAGVELTPRTAGVRDGLPLLADGRALPVTNVIWCTGFDPGFDWIKLPVLGEQEPLHHRGIVADTPGLYFVGLHFLYALSSSMVHGVGRDAEHIANQIANRARIVDDPAALVAP
jgi:putative flavoprotein involved in K+ transport